MGDNPANKSINIIVPILRTPISDKSVAKKRRSLVFLGLRNVSLYIPFLRVAMFAPWRSQKSSRKRKDPITDNSFITAWWM